MKLLQKFAILYLVAIGFLVWGFAIGHFKVFPYQVFEEVLEFAKGHHLEGDLSVTDRLLNDTGLEPRRFMRTYPANAIHEAVPVSLPGLNERREEPLTFIDPQHREGYRAIFGAFDFENYFWGGLLLDGEGNVVHAWKLSTSHLPTNKAPDELKTMYGLHVFPDGSVIFTQQEFGGGIVKVNANSEVVWNLAGHYHHTITATDDGHFWTYSGSQRDFDHKLVKISVETGEIETVIDMADVRKQNPFLHIFNLQNEDGKGSDISHGNDIDPLSRELAPKFEGFEAGDLLMSYRTQNLVFVLDPETLEVKWWRIGATDRQHDGDWESNGKITVFSNNTVTDRAYSDIVEIDPQSYAHRTIVNGEPFEFYSAINGRQERSPFNTRMVTSTTQGWAFEVDDQNKIVFSFVNNYRKSDSKSLNVSEAIRLPRQYFTEEFWKSCGN